MFLCNTVLQKEQEEKTKELNAKKLRIDRDSETLSLSKYFLKKSLQKHLLFLISEQSVHIES